MVSNGPVEERTIAFAHNECRSMVAAGSPRENGKEEHVNERTNRRPTLNTEKKATKSEKNNRAQEMSRLNAPGQT